MSKKRDNKRKVEIKGYDIAKLRFQRFLLTGTLVI